MKDGGLDGGQAEEPVVEHLLEDLEVAQERGGWLGVAVDADRVGIRTGSGRGDRAGGVRGVVRAVLAGQDPQPHRRDRLDRERYQKVRKNA